MSKSKKIIICTAFVIVFVLCLIIYVIKSPAGDFITIKSDGRIIEQVDLKTVTVGYEIEVKHNGFNKIRITDSGAFVYEADCPDKLCIHQSKKGIYPIICLPHKLVIERADKK